jgi:hypothetical protein
MKNLSLKIVGLCLVFFAGIVVARAQAVQAAEPPSQVSQNWDRIALQQNQQDVANLNSGNDDKKFAQIQQDAAQADIDAMAARVNEQLAADLLEQQIRMADAGFLAIPGFTFTGDNDVDQANYEAAKENLNASDPVTFRQFFQE